MKKILIALAVVSIFACKKKTEEPAPVVVTPDYADSLVGSYLGAQTVYESDNNTHHYYNASGTVTVTKLSKNKISVLYPFSPYQITPTFNLSDRGDGNIRLAPEGFIEYSSGWNVYFISPANQLNFYIKDGNPLYYRFQGTKQ